MTLVVFEHIPISDNNEPLVDLATFNFVLEPAYYNQGLSNTAKMFLRSGVADKLSRVQDSLGSYRLKIWDAWRPRSVQRNIYQSFWNDLARQHPEWDEAQLKKAVGTFCTTPDNPQRIPPHATGGAVDLTLVDRHGKELHMGTKFDYLGPEAASMYFEEGERDKKIRDNRRLLREAMASEDFRHDDDEWWDFNWGSQIWAATKKQPCACYGEALDPNIYPVDF